MPRLSVLMPVYNTAAYLMEALESIRAQTLEDFELLVINDGSTDGSSKLLATVARNERRMRLIERPNRGLVETRNQLLQEANGEVVAWMDSDDLSAPNRLERQLRALDADPQLVCVGSNIGLIDPDGHSLGSETYPTEDSEIRVLQQSGGGLRFGSTMQRRGVALEVGFRADFPMGEDFDFLLRVAESGKVSNLPETLYIYRQHLASTCTAFGRNWPVYRQVILDLAQQRRTTGKDALQRGEPIAFPEPDPAADQQFHSDVLVEWARNAQAIGDRRRALRYLSLALRREPATPKIWRRLAKLILNRP